MRRHPPDEARIAQLAEIERAFAELLQAAPEGWYVGDPQFEDERGVWTIHAFDRTEQPIGAMRERDWTAVAQTEKGVIPEMTRYLQEISEGRWPR